MHRRRSSILGLSHSKPPVGRSRPSGALLGGRRADSGSERRSEDGDVRSEALPAEVEVGSNTSAAREDRADLKRRVTFGAGVGGGGRAAKSGEAAAAQAHLHVSRVSRASRVSLGTLSSNDVAARTSRAQGEGAEGRKKMERSKSVLSVYQGFSDMLLG